MPENCDSSLYVVSLLLPVQRQVRAADADEARSIALRETLVMPLPGTSVGFPESIDVVMEMSDAADHREATAL